MSSTEPPSRIPPRQQPHETKAARDELSSKGKVEKVREVDPDEEARKKRFLQYYQKEDANEEPETRPSPFDLVKGGAPPSFGDIEDAIVPNINPSLPPDLNAGAAPKEEDENEEALPQSEDFWDTFDLPDQPLPPSQFQKIPDSSRKGISSKASPHISSAEKKIREEEKEKLEKELLAHQKQPTLTHTQKKQPLKEKHTESSPFGLPGKAPKPSKKEEEPFKIKDVTQKEKQKLPSPFEEVTQRPSATTPTIHRKEKGKEPQSEKKRAKTEKEELETLESLPIQPERRAEEEGHFEKKEKGVEITPTTLPTFPSEIASMAMSATNQAITYLNPTTISLFYQMIGTIFIAQNQSGVTRTEIVLNHPSYSGSKFYGSTITIEKYATAPDSFNIRLSGSHEAVVTFKENIPSLLDAFQNEKFTFKVNRIDAEYTLERPVFRRKERGTSKDQSAGGDLGERRK